MKTPWAILLVKFSDDNAEPYPRTRYEEIFTSAGAGKWGMADYFRDMSHGKLDLSGSEVFGWYTLEKTKNDYVGSGINPTGRQDLIDWARAVATEDGVELANFFSVVVVLNDTLDLFGGASGVVCGDDGTRSGMSGLSPSFLGQEMGHTYGLMHSRREGSSNDYGDPYDVMSVATALMAPHPLYTELDTFGQPVFRVGPGLNAANMWSQGWLDQARVWSDVSSSRVSTTIQLRPLHRYDLPGLLAARFNDYFIEFRMNAGWDSSLDPVVLVHSMEMGHSYLVPDNDGDDAFEAGSSISTPTRFSVLGSGFHIKVESIDIKNQIATLSLGRTSPQLPRDWPKDAPFKTPWIVWGDNVRHGDAVIAIDADLLSISRQSLIYKMLENVALYMRAESTTVSSNLRAAVRQEAIGNILALSQEELSRLRFREPSRLIMNTINMPNDTEGA